MERIRNLVIAATAMVLATAAAVKAADISISAEISRASLPFEGKDTLIVKLVWEGNPFSYQIDDFPMPQLEKLKILGSSSGVASRPDAARLSGEVTTRTFTYILEPTDFGTGIINPLNLTATNRTTGDKQDLKTGRLTVEIAKPVPRKEAASKTGILLISLAIVVAGGGAAAYWMVKNRQRRAQPETAPGEKQYLDMLVDIKKETVSDGKLFYSRLYRLLLQYLEKEAGLALTGMTGEEVLSAVNHLENEQERAVLAAWLEKALKVKFRPEAPSPADIEDMYGTVVRFFEEKMKRT